MTELCYDSVADGKPSRDRVLWAGAILFGAVAAGKVYHGDYVSALDSGVFAIWMLFTDKAMRTYWRRGYHDAVRSTVEQIVRQGDKVRVEKKEDG